MQTEMRNCLAEALPYALAERGPVIPTGSGPWELRRSVPVFCKSTDGFAGVMLVSLERFQDAVTARLALESIGDPGDDFVQLFGPPVPVVEVPYDPASDDCPF